MALAILSPTEQVVAHLREEILGGRWKEEMPGVAYFQTELGVNHVTINAALRLLEQQGLLASQGPRRCRRIVGTHHKIERKSMRIRILLYDRESRYAPHHIALLDELHQAGFEARFTRQSLHELGMAPSRVAKLVGNTEADAWVVSGATPEVLDWFAEQAVPAMALFGRFSDMPIAGTGVRKSPIMSDLVCRLVALGHQRICMLSHRERLLPKPALYELNFLKALADCGITTSHFHLPIWDPSSKGLHQCLDRLFTHTPPTALIIEEPQHLIAVRQYLSSKGIHSPQHISLICSDSDPSFTWCDPPVTHMNWNLKKLVNHVVRWANQLANGKESWRQQLLNAELVEGGTIGPPP